MWGLSHSPSYLKSCGCPGDDWKKGNVTLLSGREKRRLGELQDDKLHLWAWDIMEQMLLEEMLEHMKRY